MTADECPACGIPLGLFTPRERQRHVNDCLDACKTPAATAARVTCAVCTLDITKLTEAARAEHANRCLDASTATTATAVAPRRRPRAARMRPVAPPDTPPCDPAVMRLLESLALARYADRFARDEVDLDALRMLGEADLVAMRIPEAARRRLAAALTNIDLLRRLAGADDVQDNVVPVQPTQQLPTSRLTGARTRKEDTDFDDVADAFLYTQRRRRSSASTAASPQEQRAPPNLDGGSELDDLYDSACIEAALSSQRSAAALLSPPPLGDTDDGAERPSTPEDDTLVATLDHDSPMIAAMSPAPLGNTNPPDGNELPSSSADGEAEQHGVKSPARRTSSPTVGDDDDDEQRTKLGTFGNIRLRYAPSPCSGRRDKSSPISREGPQLDANDASPSVVDDDVHPVRFEPSQVVDEAHSASLEQNASKVPHAQVNDVQPDCVQRSQVAVNGGTQAQCDECKLDDVPPESGGLSELERWRKAMRERELKRYKRKLEEIDDIYMRMQVKLKVKNAAQSDVVDLTLDDTPAPAPKQRRPSSSVIDTATSPAPAAAPWQMQKRLDTALEAEARSGKEDKGWKAYVAVADSSSESEEEQSFAQRVAARCKSAASALDDVRGGGGSSQCTKPPPPPSVDNVHQEESHTQRTRTAEPALLDTRSRDTVASVTESQTQTQSNATRGSRLKRARRCTQDELRGAVRGDASLFDAVLQGRMVEREALMACATRRGLKASWALIDEFAHTEGLSVRARAVGAAKKARGAQWFKDMCTQELQG